MGRRRYSAMAAVWGETAMQRWQTKDRPRIQKLLDTILESEDLYDSHAHATALVNYLDGRSNSFFYDSFIDLQNRTRLISSLLTCISCDDTQSELNLLKEEAIKSLKGWTRQNLYKLLVARRENLVAQGTQMPPLASLTF